MPTFSSNRARISVRFCLSAVVRIPDLFIRIAPNLHIQTRAIRAYESHGPSVPHYYIHRYVTHVHTV